MSPWATFYEGREGASYLAYVKQRYAPFIDAIEIRIDHKDLVLEIGCGTSTITKTLSDREILWNKVAFAATDVDPAMVDITRQRIADPEVRVYREDVLDKFPTHADVVHSHGMLEHFDDLMIGRILDNYRHARAQVHYVPGLYDKPTFGDERLMSVDAWWKICKPAGLSQIITFNDGLDYALVFE